MTGGNITREQIVETADRLFYERGFEHTSFADIAQAVGISRGNFYYHFKSKNEILSAVVALRLSKTQAMLDEWERGSGDPADRIRRFIEILIVNQTKIMLYGCPVGTLATELAKLGHRALPEVNGLFELFRRWLRRQFDLLGLEGEADAYAMHLLSRSQGIATLTNAFRDEAFVRAEVALLHEWLAARIAKPATLGS